MTNPFKVGDLIQPHPTSHDSLLDSDAIYRVRKTVEDTHVYIETLSGELFQDYGLFVTRFKLSHRGDPEIIKNIESRISDLELQLFDLRNMNVVSPSSLRLRAVEDGLDLLKYDTCGLKEVDVPEEKFRAFRARISSLSMAIYYLKDNL